MDVAAVATGPVGTRRLICETAEERSDAIARVAANDPQLTALSWVESGVNNDEVKSLVGVWSHAIRPRSSAVAAAHQKRKLHSQIIFWLTDPKSVEFIKSMPA